MTAETILTDYELRYHQRKNLNTMGATDVQITSYIKAGRAIEQAVLQSPEIQALRKDAERYRWLRDSGSDDMGVVTGIEEIDYGSTYVAYTYEDGLCGEQLDKAIDAAKEQHHEP